MNQKCVRCGLVVGVPCVPNAVNDNDPPYANENGEMIQSPCARALRDIEFNADLARFYVRLGMSGDRTADWVLDRLYEPDGPAPLYPDGSRIDMMTVYPHDDFGEDAGRSINRHRNRATRHFRQRLHWRLVPMIRWLWIARHRWEAANDR